MAIVGTCLHERRTAARVSTPDQATRKQKMPPTVWQRCFEPHDSQSPDGCFGVLWFVAIGFGGAGLTVILDTTGLRPRFSMVTSSNSLVVDELLRLSDMVTSFASLGGFFWLSAVGKLYVYVGVRPCEIQQRHTKAFTVLIPNNRVPE